MTYRAKLGAAYTSAAFIATTIVIVVLVVLQWRSFRSVEAHARKVSLTLETARELTEFGTLVADAETGQRGFLLTGLPQYLEPYNTAKERLPPTIDSLEHLVAADSSQLVRVARLETLSRAKLDELHGTLLLASKDERDSALEVVKTNVGDSLMRSIRSELSALAREQDSNLRARQAALEASFNLRDVLSTVLAALLLLMLAGVYYVLRRLRRYSNLVTLCAWSKAVNYRGEWLSFEDYLQRRFGISSTHGISPDALAKLETESGRE